MKIFHKHLWNIRLTLMGKNKFTKVYYKQCTCRKRARHLAFISCLFHVCKCMFVTDKHAPTNISHTSHRHWSAGWVHIHISISAFKLYLKCMENYCIWLSNTDNESEMHRALLHRSVVYERRIILVLLISWSYW